MTSPRGTLVPLYSYPGTAPWSAITQSKQAHPSVPVIAIVNPASGPGSGSNPDYVSGIAGLLNAGVQVIGYVPTTYGNRSSADVHADVDKYRSWYPNLQGIFFDEMANTAGHEGYYSDVSGYAKSQGLGTTVGNPGAPTLESYVNTIDTIVVYENAGPPGSCQVSSWQPNYDRGKFAILGYRTSGIDGSYVNTCTTYAGWLYLTDADLPNPWATLSSYFNGLLGFLQ